MSLRKIADYTITRELGRGGMGTVFQALSPKGATVALKTVLWPEGVDPRDRWEAIERFQREARAARSLTHPNICQVLDFGADEESLYIVMEFLDGETVHDLIALAGGIKVVRAVEIVCDVGEALGHAHEQGIIHRDVKPRNVMVPRAGQVKLTDFGVASVLRETTLTTSGKKMGTVYYMSPEQVRGEKLDGRSDIFSLGVTFYEMLAGRRPFEAEESAAVMNQILTTDPPPIPGLPAELSEVLQRCLRKDPQERFESARAMVTSLSAAGAEAAVDSTAVMSEEQPESAAARPRRRPWLPGGLRRWPALAAAAAVLAVGAALLLFRPVSRPAGEPTVVPRFPPSLKPLDRGLVATYHYGSMGRIGGIAVKPDGTVLVTVGEADEVPPGVYVARAGDDCDPSDAYTQPGAPFVSPGGIAVHPDGRVVVADSGASTVWVIPAPGAPAEVLTDQIPSPCDVVVAREEFDGPDVDPGDFLVCASSSAGPDAFGLYRVDAVTGAVRHLTGPAELQNGLLWAGFGPGGTLYAAEDDRNTQDGFTIVTISPDGGATSFLGNAVPTYFGQPVAGPIAVHPTTGDILGAYRSTIYRLPAGWQPGDLPEVYAEQGLEITALEFSPDGSSLLVSDAGEDVLAKIALCPIEGKLLIAGLLDPTTTTPRGGFSYLLEGRSDVAVPVPRPGYVSPLGDELIYDEWHPYPADKPWLTRLELWKADLRDQSEVNLTESAGVRGANCQAVWSPDGRWIAFMHCDPIKEAKPCETGFDIWVMRADGTEAHRVVGAGPEVGERPPSERMPAYSWSVNGDRVIYAYGLTGPVMSCDLDGTDRQAFPAFPGNMSPDGSKIVDAWVEPGISDGEPGAWRQLRLTNSDGSGRQTLIEHFVKDSDVVEHLRLLGEENPEDPRWLDDARAWVGPKHVTWSPKGDRVVFLAALPSFDPQGVHYKLQPEVWIYELATGILTRLTHEGECPTMLSWRGPNTYPEDPQVTVGNTTVMFSEVASEGLTTVIRDDDRPAEPGGYQFGDYYYDIRTTAQYEGPVRIAMKYADEDVAGGNEQALAILRYDAARDEWEDITTSRDPKKNIVYGEVDSL